MVFMLMSQRLNEGEAGAALRAAARWMAIAGEQEPPPVSPPPEPVPLALRRRPTRDEPHER